MFGDVLADHRIRDGARGYGEVAARPQVPAPELFPEVREFFEQHAGADPFQPLDDLTDALVRAVGDQEVDMVACHLPRDDVQFTLHGNFPQEVADAEGDRPHKDRFAVLRDPDEVDLEVVLAVRPTPVGWHATILPHPGTRLKARGFDHP